MSRRIITSDFLKTLAFLRNEPPDSDGLKQIQNDLQRFRERLVQAHWATEDDQELFELRSHTSSLS